MSKVLLLNVHTWWAFILTHSYPPNRPKGLNLHTMCSCLQSGFTSLSTIFQLSGFDREPHVMPNIVLPHHSEHQFVCDHRTTKEHLLQSHYSNSQSLSYCKPIYFRRNLISQKYLPREYHKSLQYRKQIARNHKQIALVIKPVYSTQWAWAQQNLQNELQHNKTNKISCVPSEDSDQPRHPPRLNSLLCVLNGKLRTQGFFMRTAKTDQFGRDQSGHSPRLIWVFAECTSFCWFCRAVAQMMCSSKDSNHPAYLHVCRQISLHWALLPRLHAYVQTDLGVAMVCFAVSLSL